MDIVKTIGDLIEGVFNGDIDSLGELQRELIHLKSELEQLTLTDVVKQSEQFNCYEMHAYSRFDGCNKQCKECADNEKSKAI